MRRQKPAPALRAQWWQPVRPPAVVAMTTCLMVCWVTTAVEGAPRDSLKWCSPMRDVIFRNLMEKEEFRPSPFPRPALCNDDSIRNLMIGGTCGYNASASDLWGRVCPEKSARGGSGLKPASSGATDDTNLKKVTGLMKKVACNSRFVLVDVEKAPGEEHYIFEPCQMKVKRCTGCCNNDAMVCQPTRTNTKKVTVLQMMNYGSLQNSSNGSPTDGRNFVKKNAVHHTRCECQCKPAHCSPSQQHDPNNCSCKCPAGKERSCDGSNKHFNTTSCACECRIKKICSTGMTFNDDTCRCG